MEELLELLDTTVSKLRRAVYDDVQSEGRANDGQVKVFWSELPFSIRCQDENTNYCPKVSRMTNQPLGSLCQSGGGDWESERRFADWPIAFSDGSFGFLPAVAVEAITQAIVRPFGEKCAPHGTIDAWHLENETLATVLNLPEKQPLVD